MLLVLLEYNICNPIYLSGLPHNLNFLVQRKNLHNKIGGNVNFNKIHYSNDIKHFNIITNQEHINKLNDVSKQNNYFTRTQFSKQKGDSLSISYSKGKDKTKDFFGKFFKIDFKGNTVKDVPFKDTLIMYLKSNRKTNLRVVGGVYSLLGHAPFLNSLANTDAIYINPKDIVFNDYYARKLDYGPVTDSWEDEEHIKAIVQSIKHFDTYQKFYTPIHVFIHNSKYILLDGRKYLEAVNRCDVDEVKVYVHHFKGGLREARAYRAQIKYFDYYYNIEGERFLSRLANTDLHKLNRPIKYFRDDLYARINPRVAMRFFKNKAQTIKPLHKTSELLYFTYEKKKNEVILKSEEACGNEVLEKRVTFNKRNQNQAFSC